MLEFFEWIGLVAVGFLVGKYLIDAHGLSRPKGVVSHTILEWRTDFENVPVGKTLLLMSAWNNKCFIGCHLDVRQSPFSAYAILETPKL